MFSFTQEITLKNDILSLIDIKFGRNKEKLYWNQKIKKNQFLSFGKIISLNTNELDKSIHVPGTPDGLSCNQAFTVLFVVVAIHVIVNDINPRISFEIIIPLLDNS